MEQLTLEQAAKQHADKSTPNHIILERSAREIDTIAFQAGAEWQKEQLKAHIQEVAHVLENDFAKHLVENLANIIFK